MGQEGGDSAAVATIHDHGDMFFEQPTNLMEPSVFRLVGLGAGHAR